MAQGFSPSVDLSQCEREPVHVPGSVQPFGVLIAFSLPTWSIAHVSENAPPLFNLASATAMVGQPMALVLSPQIIHDLRNVFQAAMMSGFAERMPAVPIGTDDALHDIIIHASGQLAIAEFLPCDGADVVRADPTTLVKTIIDRLRRTTTFQSFLTSAARQIRAVTCFDRVMIYKFLDDDSGQVVAEAVRSGMTPFMGLHYPASDIPAQARALFQRQWLRMIPDVAYVAVPIYPALTAKNLPLDLSLSTLRSASPVHCAYLRNMGSAATMTVSILRGDRLWGLIACHHETPRRISSTTASAIELFAQVFSTQIEARQQQDEAAYLSRARAAHDALVGAMTPEETIFENVRRFANLLYDLIPCDGVGVWSDGRFEGDGIVPPADAIDELVRMLNTKPNDRLFVTDELKRQLPDALRYTAEASGLIAIPFQGTPAIYLLMFRREVIQTVEWGGDPNKAVTADASGVIGPRASFAAWKETVSGKGLPWRTGEISVAETLRVSLLNVILGRANLVDRERKLAQETQLLLVAELNHRVKNVLAVIRSLVRQSRVGAESLDGFANDLQSRIHALSVAHDQLTQTHWKAAPLLTLIEAEARAWVETEDNRLTLSGPPVIVEARAYQTLALVLHELMTNTAKYGALSVKTGRLAIEWTLEKTGDLRLLWCETGGPEVRAPSRRGFGTIVVEQSIPFELQGEATMSYAPEGFSAAFRIPYDFVRRGEAPPAALRDTRNPVQLDLHGMSLLLVEDSMIIALDAQAMLQTCGADVELAATSSDALRAIRLNTFDTAILDVNLYTETSFAVAEALQDQAIPFVFATGYGELVTVPERFQEVHVISKPYAEDALRAALAIQHHQSRYGGRDKSEMDDVRP